MRTIVFKNERPGFLTEGQKVIVTEGQLPSNYFYSIGTPQDPFLAMSPNIPLNRRLLSKEGVVTKIEENSRGFYITADFDEEEPR